MQLGTALHPTLGPVRFRTRDIGWVPDYQVNQTIGVMGEKVREDSANPRFRVRAQRTLGSSTTELDKVHAVHGHAKRGIRFQRDEALGAGISGVDSPDDPLVEVIIRPVDMAAYVDQGIATGDCDDFSMYVAAMLESCEIPCKFVTVAADSRDPGQFTHVYVAAYPRDEFGNRVRVPVDASHGEYPGWEVANQYGRREEWDAQGSPFLTGFVSSLLAGAAIVWWWEVWGRKMVMA